jgi:protein-disulfide isomerase/uncharacterized membrane protein
MTTESTNAPNNTLWIAAFSTAIAGIATSVYSTLHHLELRLNGHTSAACNINSTINCDAVAASKYSEIFQIPLGVWGVGYFLAMAILSGTLMSGHKSSKDHESAWFLLAAAGLLSSLLLAGISFALLNAVCIVCIGIYALSIVQFGIAWKLWGTLRPNIDFSRKAMTAGFSTAGIAVAVTILAFNYLKPADTLPADEFHATTGSQTQTSASLPAPMPPKDIPVNKNIYSGLGEDFRKGPDDAKIVIVEFADYQCPGCGAMATVLEDLHHQLGNRALFVFKNFQLSNQCNATMQNDMHPYSCDVAKIARCAGSIGKFWEFHLNAFQQQKNASKEKALEWGKEVGLTTKQMNDCLVNKDIQAKILDDAALGNKIGVNSTPSVFINGQLYRGDNTAAALRAVVESL